jgi:hypothetical protein
VKQTTIRRTKHELLPVLLLLIVQGPGYAADLSGLYFGGNFGRARNDYDTGLADATLQQEAAGAGDSLTIDARSTRRLAHVWWGDVGYYLTANICISEARST